MIVKNQLKILTALLVTHHFPLMTAIDSPQSLACTENAGILPPRFARRQNDRQRAPHDMPKAMSDLLDYAITNSPPRVFQFHCGFESFHRHFKLGVIRLPSRYPLQPEAGLRSPAPNPSLRLCGKANEFIGNARN